MPGRIGEIFGSYELIQFLGRGGFAEVYLGKHTQLPQQMAAIKILDKQLVLNKSQQFQREASIVATLHHPNIVQMYDYNLYSNPTLTATLVPYIVMEYAPNKSLRVKHPRGLALPIKTMLNYIRQMADALQYAHEQDVMHLDVKPENILINVQGRLLLSDFGLATLLTEQEKTGDVQGTLSYMSPEQLDGKPGFASDQYALAVMAYEWISGYLPFTGQSVKEVIEKHLKMPPPSLTARANTLPPQAEVVIFQALAKNAQQRFPNVEAFALALDEALNLPVRVKPPTSVPRDNPFLVPDPGAGASPAPNANSISPFLNPLPGQPYASPVPPFLSPLPAQASAHPAPFSAQANRGMPQGLGPASPGTVNQAAAPDGILPLTPPASRAMAASTPAQPNRVPAPDPLAAVAANSPITPPQANAPFPFPANPQAANNFAPSNPLASPFQAGPPPGAQVSMGGPFQVGSPGGEPVGSPFLNPMAGTPSSTTVFGLPGSLPFPGQGNSVPMGPGPLPPYNATGQYSTSFSQKKSLSRSIKNALKQPSVAARRRRLPFLLPGAFLNLLGAVLIGVWIGRAVIEHDTGWWAFIFSTLFELSAITLFYHSNNSWLNSFLSVALAVYWGLIGVSIGVLASGSFLPGPDVLAFLFFGTSLALHLYLTLRRR
ncbi:MAG TPA: protein kinase [Ktedonobacteraceae bacterium]